MLIAMPWIELILEGKKVWELRARKTRRRGSIALIRKGSGQVVGVADLVDVHGPMSRQELLDQLPRHQVPPERLSGKYGFAWELRNTRRLPEAVPYCHPSGAVIWVVLSETVQNQIAAQTSTTANAAP